MRDLLFYIPDDGPLKWIVLAGNAVALLAGVVLVARSIQTRPKRPLRSLARTLGVACAGLAVAAGGTAVYFHRARALLLPPGEPPLSFYRAELPELRALGDAITNAEASLCIAAQTTIGVACLVFLAALLTRVASRTNKSAKRLRARRLLAWAAAVAGAELAGSIAVGVLRRAYAINASWYCDAECRSEIAAEAARVLADARLHVLLAAAVAFFLLTRALRRSAAAGHAPLGPRARIASVALFGAGLVAFAGTRAMARDATHLNLPRHLENICPKTSVDERSLPPASAASRIGQGPVIELSAAHVKANQRTVADPAELAKSMVEMRSLWKQLQPDRAMPPPLVAASASEPLPTLAPWIRALAAEGFSEVAILVAHPPDFVETETLGSVERAPRCASVPVKIERIERAIARGATWGELAASIRP